MRVPPLKGKNPNLNMPTHDNKNAARPLKPTLAAHARPANRIPLTPKIAGPGPPVLATPSTRRPARPNSTTPGEKEDIPTPVSTFLSHHVTPRSGPRRVRAESPKTTTPVGTPTPGPNDTIRGTETPLLYGSGLGVTGVEKDVPKRLAVSFSPAVSGVGHSNLPAQNAQNGLGDSKFFFASEAKTAAAHPPRPPMPPKKSSTFLYANGDIIPNQPQSSSASASGSTVGDERSQPKFFHANGAPDMQSTLSSYFPPPRPSSVLSSASRTASPRLAAVDLSPLSPSQRPSSPSKLNQNPSLSSTRNIPTLPSPVIPRPPHAGRGQPATNIVSKRRASIEAAQRLSHSRSASGSSADGRHPPPMRKASISSHDSSAPGSPLNLTTTSVPLTTREEVLEELGVSDPAADIRSPIKTGQSIAELNELAANARRERKVLDLQITNSSLEAINRTLEREMRKQTTELRRYRRLSRSGRFSVAATESIQTSSGSVTVGGVGEGFDLSELSEEDSVEGEEDEEEEGETSDEGSLSPSGMEESDFRHRKRDEKRLRLDLTKHQQLLVDSQKMNQSLKRCLGWTEELIREGRKALEYRVRVCDVELGGRVLAPDEIDGANGGRDAEEADNEGMSDIGASLLREARKKAKESGRASPPWGKVGKDDRDSGIELDGAPREQLGLEQ
ncbi:uncharacterized protein L3040_005236 [Drepanopeziza brunnea f. sp. 'multigermtubi']|nr:hypothetical protein L3040_005236 [Drepanopeziza brunnea f. sp. 'multigermtubi']